MRKLVAVLVVLGAVSLAAVAQETPRPEVFGGYQFTGLDPSWHGNGWNGAANFYLTRWLGVTGDFSGAYNTGTKFHTYTGGPVISTHKGNFSPFAHALFGGGHASDSLGSASGFVMMVGGGVDIGHQKMAFRAVQFDWLSTRFSGFTDNNNFRISTGMLFRF